MKPNERQQAFNAYLPGAKPNGLRRAQQIARQRTFIYERREPKCVCCGMPRERKSFPICDQCTGN